MECVNANRSGVELNQSDLWWCLSWWTPAARGRAALAAPRGRGAPAVQRRQLRLRGGHLQPVRVPRPLAGTPPPRACAALPDCRERRGVGLRADPPLTEPVLWLTTPALHPCWPAGAAVDAARGSAGWARAAAGAQPLAQRAAGAVPGRRVGMPTQHTSATSPRGRGCVGVHTPTHGQLSAAQGSPTTASA
jgi:hypothetical protein